MFIKKAVLAGMGLLLLGGAVIAQQPSAATPQQETGVRGESRKDSRLRRLKRQRVHLARTLQLSDEQRTLRKAILQRQLEATKAQREQLFQLREKRRAASLTAEDRNRAQQLRLELRKSIQGARAESLNVLTTEQKEKLANLREQRKQMRQERRQRLMEQRKNRPIG
jgi:hypothetical protein